MANYPGTATMDPDAIHNRKIFLKISCKQGHFCTKKKMLAALFFYVLLQRPISGREYNQNLTRWNEI
jgi:hypothetical protein